MQITTAYVKDLTGTLKVIWFRMPFLRNTLKQGMPVIIRGRVVSKKDQLIMEHPELFSPPDSYDKKWNSSANLSVNCRYDEQCGSKSG